MRTHPGLRSKAVQVALLRWLRQQRDTPVPMPVTTKILETDYGRFEGDRLTEAEINQEADYLAEHGLIKGHRGGGALARAKITADGIDCLDYIDQHGGSVSDYRWGPQAAGASFHINTFTNNGAVAMGNQGDSILKVGTGTDLVALGGFIQTLLRELPNLRLTPDTESVVRAEFEATQRVMEGGNPSPQQVVGTFGRAVSYLVDAGKPAVTSLLLLLAQHYAGPLAS